MDEAGYLIEGTSNEYGVEIDAIPNTYSYFLELVKLSHIGLQQKQTIDFDINTLRLLEYVHRTKDEKQIVLLLETLKYIQLNTPINVVANDMIVKGLCDLLEHELTEMKTLVYTNILKILNYSNNDYPVSTIMHIKSKIHKFDAHIYELFDFPLSMELLHMYLHLDRKEFDLLYSDIFLDWKVYFDHQLTEDLFEKLLWYDYIANFTGNLNNSLSKYQSFVKSEKWEVKFYRFTINNLKGKVHSDPEKIQRAIEIFKKSDGYSLKEKEIITNKIQLELKNGKNVIDKAKLNNPIKDKKITKEIPGKKAQELPKEKIKELPKLITKEIKRLSPHNISPGVRMGDINKNINIHLGVYKNEKMEILIRTIEVNALTDGRDIYVNKPILKEIKDKVKEGYIHVIDNKGKKEKALLSNSKSKSKKLINDDLFTWPSTTVKGTGYNQENELGLKETSALRSMGYQITDVTREKRWTILQRAVPVLGLRTVAYTIAGNVKLRKGQKNGSIKFSYAIREWENDLRKLKIEYYKKDFTWPST